MQNLQPVPQLNAMLKAIQSEIYDNALNTPQLQIQPITLCQQIIEAQDNSAMLNLAITFDAPDTNDACDFAFDEAYAIAKHIILSNAQSLNQYNPGSVTQNPLLQSNTLIIFNHIDGLTYFNATLTVTDCTLYIHCIYNQQ